MIIHTLVVFSYSILAFYIAVNGYISDRSSRLLIQKETHRYITLLNKTVYARNAENSAISKKIALEALTTECNTLKSQILVTDSLLPTANETYSELYALNKTCHDNLDTINGTFVQLITKPTIHLVGQGSCQLASNMEFDPSVAFKYKRLILNGFDFYYYVFHSSTLIYGNDTKFSIHSCSPAIFNGPVSRQGYKDGIIGDAGPIYMDIGEFRVNITATSEGYVQLDEFQVWVRGM